MALRLKLYLLWTAVFAIFYAILVVVARSIGFGGLGAYGVMAAILLGIQYFLGPTMVNLTMGVRQVSEEEEPELHAMVEDLARRAGIPKPKVGVSPVQIPNAFAYGTSLRDGRVCVTEPLRRLLSKDELKAVLGHEISHLKNRDVMVITMISAIPMILWWLARHFMFSRNREGRSLAILGLFAFVLYFATNLLVLFASRLREYYADKGSVDLGCSAHHLASALYKLVYGSARMPREALHEAEGVKAFFLNDVSAARAEIRELKAVDQNASGSIDPSELEALRSGNIRVGGADTLMEMLSTHPNMLRRIQRLAEYAPAGS